MQDGGNPMDDSKQYYDTSNLTYEKDSEGWEKLHTLPANHFLERDMVLEWNSSDVSALPTQLSRRTAVATQTRTKRQPEVGKDVFPGSIRTPAGPHKRSHGQFELDVLSTSSLGFPDRRYNNAQGITTHLQQGKRRRYIPIPEKPKATPPNWTVVKAPALARKSSHASIPTSSALPRIWMADKDELTGIMPAYAYLTNHVSLVSEMEPALLLDGKDWAQDAWDGGKSIHVTMTRDISFPTHCVPLDIASIIRRNAQIVSLPRHPLQHPTEQASTSNTRQCEDLDPAANSFRNLNGKWELRRMDEDQRSDMSISLPQSPSSEASFAPSLPLSSIPFMDMFDIDAHEQQFMDEVVNMDCTMLPNNEPDATFGPLLPTPTSPLLTAAVRPPEPPEILVEQQVTTDVGEREHVSHGSICALRIEGNCTFPHVYANDTDTLLEVSNPGSPQRPLPAIPSQPPSPSSSDKSDHYVEVKHVREEELEDGEICEDKEDRQSTSKKIAEEKFAVMFEGVYGSDAAVTPCIVQDDLHEPFDSEAERVVNDSTRHLDIRAATLATDGEFKEVNEQMISIFAESSTLNMTDTATTSIVVLPDAPMQQESSPSSLSLDPETERMIDDYMNCPVSSNNSLVTDNQSVLVNEQTIPIVSGSNAPYTSGSLTPSPVELPCAALQREVSESFDIDTKMILDEFHCDPNIIEHSIMDYDKSRNVEIHETEKIKLKGQELSTPCITVTDIAASLSDVLTFAPLDQYSSEKINLEITMREDNSRSYPDVSALSLTAHEDSVDEEINKLQGMVSRLFISSSRANISLSSTEQSSIFTKQQSDELQDAMINTEIERVERERANQRHRLISYEDFEHTIGFDTLRMLSTSGPSTPSLTNRTPSSITASPRTPDRLPDDSMLDIEYKIMNPDTELIDLLPAEIRTMYSAYEFGVPVTLVASSSWSNLPFRLPMNCKYAVLGFFHVALVEMTFRTSSILQGYRNNSRRIGQISCRFQFEWTEGGDPETVFSLPHSVPWWMTQSSFENMLSKFENISIEEDSNDRPRKVSPNDLAYTLLPPYLENERFNWFHCKKCGKSNMKGWMGRMRCSNCRTYVHDDAQTINAIPSDRVRDIWRSIPLFHPEMVCPRTVNVGRNIISDGIMVFLYRPCDPDCEDEGEDIDEVAVNTEATQADETIEKGPCIELVFTRNDPELESDAETLFILIQEKVDMQLDGKIGRGGASARYRYTVEAKSSATKAEDDGTPAPSLSSSQPSVTWSTAASAIRDARTHMLEYAQAYTAIDVKGTDEDHFEALAWLAESGTKSRGLADGRNCPVIFLSLGADLDFYIDSWDPDQAPAPQKSKKPASKKAGSKSKKGRKSKAVASIEDDPIDTLADMMQSAQMLGLVDSDDDGEDTEDQGEIVVQTKKVKPGVTRITLTHGNLLVVRDCQLSYSVTRSGFSMLFKWYR